MEITNMYLTPNEWSRPCTKRNKTTKIAVHYCGNAGSTAKNNRDYFENLRINHSRYVSSNYIVGLEGEVICCVPDEEIAYCTNQANSYSVSIETCHPKDDGVFNDKTYVSLCELCAFLLKKYNLTIDDLIRHYDVTAKTCPLDWSPTKYQSVAIANAKWQTFKNDVKTVLNGGTVTKNNTVNIKSNTISTTVSTSTTTTTDSKLKYSPSKTYPVPSGMKFYTDGSKNVVTKFSYKAHANYFLSPHFQVKEFVSMSGNKLYSDEIKIHNRLIEMLEALYAKLDCKAVIINSGYRTNQHSIDVGGYAGDTHSLGQAVDITCLDKNGKVISAKKVCCTLEDFGNVYGIGYISENSVHADTRAKSKQWFGDETKSGAPNIKKLGYKSFHDYFKM